MVQKTPANKTFQKPIATLSSDLHTTKVLPNHSVPLEDLEGIQINILKRENSSRENRPTSELFPIRPYHQRWLEYVKKRKEIFDISSVRLLSNKKPKRSTLRLRKYFKLRKMTSKFLISSIVNDPQDQRLYAQVSFLHFTEHGLLDTGFMFGV